MNCTNLKLFKPGCSFVVPSVYCTIDAAEKVLEELDVQFPGVAVLDALRVVYPHIGSKAIARPASKSTLRSS